MSLETESKTYERELPTLLDRAGKFVVIHGDKIIGVFAAYEDALEAGYQKVGVDEAFLVKKIEASEKLHFLSRGTHPCPT